MTGAVGGEASGDGGCTGGGAGGGGGGADGGRQRFKRLITSSKALLSLVWVAALPPSSGVSMSAPPVIVVAVAVAGAGAGARAGAGRSVSRALSFPPNRKPRNVQLTAVLLVATSAVLGGVTSCTTLPAARASKFGRASTFGRASKFGRTSKFGRASKSPNDWNAAQSSIVVAAPPMTAPAIANSSLLLVLWALSCVAFVENSVRAPPRPKRHQGKAASLAFARLVTPLAASTEIERD